MPNVELSTHGSKEEVVKQIDASDLPAQGKTLIKAMIDDFPEKNTFSVAFHATGRENTASFSCTVVANAVTILDENGALKVTKS